MLVLLTAFSFSCARVDPSHEGILMTNCGKKGIEDFKVVSGRVNTMGFCTDLFEIPMFQQEGNIDIVELTLAGGTTGFSVSPEYRYHAIRGKGREIAHENNRFGSGKSFLENVEREVLNGRIREVAIDLARSYTADDILNNMIKYEADVQKAVEEQFKSVHFELKGFTLNLTPPQSLITSIDRRNEEIEETKREEERLKREEKQIEVDLQRARANVEIAKLEAQANIERSKGLTREVLQSDWIKAWETNGAQVPQVIAGDKDSPFMITIKK